MTIGIVARKCGMTRLFTSEGLAVPVTVVQVEPNRVTQIKTMDKEGYWAIQVTCGTRPGSRVDKPTAGHLAKANVEAGRGFWEFRTTQAELEGMQLGQEINWGIFKIGQKVDVIGLTRGKGFAGTIKRHHFSSQDATHGNSRSHRVPGSVGQNQTPGRVYKGKKMPGQLGNARRTVQNLEIAGVDASRNLLMITGAVPGAPGTDVIVRPAIKSS